MPEIMHETKTSMTLFQLEIILIASVVAVACSLPGTFLVLRKVALMSDAISHAILLGIVLAFFAVKSIHSPFLMAAAVITGLVTVLLTELIISTNRIKKDAAIGLVFPVFFSLGVILINLFARNIHLDQDAVLLGEIAFAPFDRFYWHGFDLGPKSLWVMGGILLLNIGFIIGFYKELALVTFDEGLAKTLGFSPRLMHYLVMLLVSITSVGAFNVVGSILVVALMITPPATAYLLTTSLNRMLVLSGAIGALSALLGYGLALLLDASISGCMATVTGIFFLLALFFSSQHGLWIKYRYHAEQKIKFSLRMLVVQLLGHEGGPDESLESSIHHLSTHMGWKPRQIEQVVRLGLSKRYVIRDGNQLRLTRLGREVARAAMMFD